MVAAIALVVAACGRFVVSVGAGCRAVGCAIGRWRLTIGRRSPDRAAGLSGDLGGSLRGLHR